MTTNSEESADRIELSVAAGRIRLAVRLGDRDKVSYITTTCYILYKLLMYFVLDSFGRAKR